MRVEDDEFDKKSTRLKPFVTLKHKCNCFEFYKSTLNYLTYTFVDNYDSLLMDEN